MDGNSSQICPDELLDRFSSSIAKKLLRATGLMLINAILMGIVGCVGVLKQHARHNPMIGFILLGASALFLPIVSDVAATIGSDAYFNSSLMDGQVVAAKCEPGMHIVLVLVWTAVVVTVGINISTVVDTDAREGRSVVPPAELLIKAVWVSFLIIITTSTRRFLDTRTYIGSLLGNEKAITLQLLINFALVMGLPYFKMCLKYIMFHYHAKRSVAFSRNTQLIVAYMDPDTAAHINEKKIPKLIVGGEAQCYNLEEQPGGFSLQRKTHRDNNGDGKPVTLDRVWEQSADTFLKLEHKDLCFSFALFKLLRCRFAKYTLSEAGFKVAQFFFRQEYLSGNRHDRVFQVITDELSFIESYYNTSLPIYCSHKVFVTTSLIGLGYCLYMYVFISQALDNLRGRRQVFCVVWCPGRSTLEKDDEFGTLLGFGSALYDVIPVYVVLFVLFISEARDIVYYVCTNWTQVSLICSYLQHTYSPPMEKCIGFLVNCCRWRRLNRWGRLMGQCSVLVRLPWWNAHPLIWRFFGGFPEQKSAEVPREVKQYVFDALRKGLTVEHEGAVEDIRRPSPPVTIQGSENGSNAFSASGCQAVGDTILVWHIVTSIFELKDQKQSDHARSKVNPSPSSYSDDKKVATHLSRYCAYLVACRPELLPDEDYWCKTLYRDVLLGANRILREARGEGFQRVIELLKQEPHAKNSVLKSGGTLVQQLMGDPRKGWKELAVFWSEMILYIAPSENLDGHAEAIARGGELVTLLWALLAHAGIVHRHVEATTETSTVAGDAFNTSAEVVYTAGDHHV